MKKKHEKDPIFSELSKIKNLVQKARNFIQTADQNFPVFDSNSFSLNNLIFSDEDPAEQNIWNIENSKPLDEDLEIDATNKEAKIHDQEENISNDPKEVFPPEISKNRIPSLMNEEEIVELTNNVNLSSIYNLLNKKEKDIEFLEKKITPINDLQLLSRIERFQSSSDSFSQKESSFEEPDKFFPDHEDPATEPEFNEKKILKNQLWMSEEKTGNQVFLNEISTLFNAPSSGEDQILKKLEEIEKDLGSVDDTLEDLTSKIEENANSEITIVFEG